MKGSVSILLYKYTPWPAPVAHLHSIYGNTNTGGQFWQPASSCHSATKHSPNSLSPTDKHKCDGRAQTVKLNAVHVNQSIRGTDYES